MERVEVKTKAAAEKAVKAGNAIKIVTGSFTLAFTGLPVNIEVAPEADIHITLTDCGTGSSSAELWGSSRAELWGSSRAELWGSSRAVLRESSSAELWGSSSAEAFGYSTMQVRSPQARPKASATVCVNLWDGSTCEGGRQQVVTLITAQDWCDFYGARVEGNCAILYKAVGDNYMSYHGVRYAPGTMPKDEAWDGKGEECAKGGGLNFSPTPRYTHQFVTNPKHYLECRVRLEDLVLHWDGSYPEKVCAREVAAPLIEVDMDGVPIVA